MIDHKDNDNLKDGAQVSLSLEMARWGLDLLLKYNSLWR